LRPLLGIAVILLLAWAISEDRWRIPWRLVATGVLLQFALALLFLKFPPAAAAFLLLNDAVEAVQKATEAGTGFVFGYLGGGDLPFPRAGPAPPSSSRFAPCQWCWWSARWRRSCSIGASCSGSCRPSPGSCAARSGSAGRSGSAPRCTSLSATS